jgi:3-hydroxymyristoyl/3-hydroxydecanoyl-(acyl carrier protein) dehydratase
MVDRMVRCVPHESTVTSKTVTASDAVMPRTGSHEVFFPSVMILEGLSQTAALLFRASYGPAALTRAPLLGYLKARIRGGARPGDTLCYTVTAIKMTSRSGVFFGVARVGTTVIASTELAFGVAAS